MSASRTEHRFLVVDTGADDYGSDAVFTRSHVGSQLFQGKDFTTVNSTKWFRSVKLWMLSVGHLPKMEACIKGIRLIS